MNLAIISGTLGPIKDENVFTRTDGTTVVDGCIKKLYYIGDKVKESKFFYTISGNKADAFLDECHEGDKVILSGKLVSKIDEDGRCWFTINCTSVAKLDDKDSDL